ncbi:uncharacterized protein LOC129122679 [Agelaius phoeniceus]|uniref:uncharacterized protein LOC129122679 n=1 Tax=Agelaius phoeniceus TaxID=39638 RepID=UPI004054C9BF
MQHRPCTGPAPRGVGAYLGPSERGPRGAAQPISRAGTRTGSRPSPAAAGSSALQRFTHPSNSHGLRRRCASPGSGHGSVRGWMTAAVPAQLRLPGDAWAGSRLGCWDGGRGSPGLTTSPSRPSSCARLPPGSERLLRRRSPD